MVIKFGWSLLTGGLCLEVYVQVYMEVKNQSDIMHNNVVFTKHYYRLLQIAV